MVIVPILVQMATADLDRTLTLWPSVGLAVTMVAGSGVLVLPGIAYDDRGASAVWSWVAAAVVCIPLLKVIAVLGGKYPSAGGIAGFVRPSLGGRVADVCELLLLAAIPGGAGLALVAGHLVGDVLDRSWLVEPVAVALLGIAALTASRGAEFAGSVMRVLAGGVVIVLAVVAVGGLVAGGDGLGPGEITGVGQGAVGVGLVFFAFVGWELMTFLSEDFIDAKRDFPRMIAISFAVVVSLYIALALAVQVVLDPNDDHVTTSPVATVAEQAFGEIGRTIVTLVGLVIVTANVNGVVLAFSRLVLNGARSGRLPSALAVADDRRLPRRAVLATAAAFGVCIFPVRLGLVSHGVLFELAGSVFFTGFIIAALAFTAEATRRPARIFGLATSGLSAIVLFSFGWIVLYPLTVGLIGTVTVSRVDSATRR
jgi:amino acid efflux transporter